MHDEQRMQELVGAQPMNQLLGESKSIGENKSRGVSRGDAKVSEASFMAFPQKCMPTDAALSKEAPSCCEERRSCWALDAAACARRSRSVATRKECSASVILSRNGPAWLVNCHSVSVMQPRACTVPRHRTAASPAHAKVANHAKAAARSGGSLSPNRPINDHKSTNTGRLAVQSHNTRSASSNLKCNWDKATRRAFSCLVSLARFSSTSCMHRSCERTYMSTSA
mmetsp:Transcript_7595/g.21590  ORF Transcript_7595/g.21590 Transcript_7595/m.21590 type:complete len:225 (-) Transcript_7595:371-1045(-)